MCHHLLLRLGCCGIVFAIIGNAQEHHAQHAWDYTNARGPSHWGDLKPAYAPCKTGHEQSPIDITEVKKADLPAIEFDYRPSPLHIVDNGHTVMVNYVSGSSIRVAGRRYELKQFHFHRPSEEKINGKGFDMSLHLVHVSESGKLAVVAVLLQQGEDTSPITELWKNLPQETTRNNLSSPLHINASLMLPPDRNYFTYTGSLTTPPCSEGVTWFVLTHPVSVSAADIRRFSELYPNNARPTQPLGNRIVLESH